MRGSDLKQPSYLKVHPLSIANPAQRMQSCPLPVPKTAILAPCGACPSVLAGASCVSVADFGKMSNNVYGLTCCQSIREEFTMKKLLVLMLVASICAGCAGRTPNPVMIQQFADGKTSCEGLEREMIFCQEEIRRLTPKTQKAIANTVLGVTGLVFIVPLFFMDLSKAEEIEIDAYRRRYNRLLILAADRKCNIQEPQSTDK